MDDSSPGLHLLLCKLCPRCSATGLLPQPSLLIPLLFILFIDLLFKDIRTSKHPEMDHHSAPRAIPSLHQTLDEMDFERGIWAPAVVGDLAKVHYHLKRGIPVDVEDNSGYTALHYAARNGHGHICTSLLDNGAGIDKATRAGCATALHRAAMAGHADTCDILLRYGANPTSRDVDGRTPLHRAVECGHKHVILLFLERFPSAAFEKDIKGKTPLDYAEENPDLASFFKDLSDKIV